MSNIYTRIIKVILVSYLFINAVIWALSSVITEHYLSEFLASKHLILGEKSTIRYNPFISQIKITDLSIGVAQSQPNKGEVISIPSATVEFSLFKLFAKKVVIEEFYVDGLQADVGLALVHLNSLPPELISEISEIQELKTKPQQIEGQPQSDVVNVKQDNVDDLSRESLNKDVPDTEKPAKNWFMSLTFEMPLFNMTHSKVLFDIAGDQQNVDLDRLMISDVLVSEKSQSAEINIALLFNKALFEFDASLKLNNGVGEVQYALDLQELNLSHFASVMLKPLNSQYQNIEGLLSVKAEQDIAFNKADISSQIQDVNLLLTGLSLSQQASQQGIKQKYASNMSFNIASLAIKDGVVDISLPYSLMGLLNPEQSQPINITDDLILRSNLNVKQSGLIVSSNDVSGKSSTELVNVSKVSIPDIDFVLENSQGFLQTNLVELDDITLVDIKNADIDENDDLDKSANSKSLNELPLLKVVKLSFADIQASNNGLKIGNIDITKVSAAITKSHKDKIVQLDSLLPVSVTAGADVTATENTKNKDDMASVEKTTEINQANSEKTSSEAKSTEPFNLYIGKVSLQDKLSFAISDSSVTPSYRNIIYINTLSVEPIDNSMPRVTSKVLVSGSLDQYSKFNIDAEIKPFNKEKYIKADVTVTEFDLSTITMYLKNIMAIESGHLNTITNFIINGDAIKGNAKLNLSRVELAKSVEYDQESSIDTLIPVNVALSMLKDGDGNIELEVPVEGNLDDPNFRLSGFMALLVKRATMSATKNYLINAFVPYANIVQIGMQAGDFILKVRFQDLILTTGEDELPKSANVFLEQFAALMLDKKSTQITICALSTKSDIGVEYSEKLTNKQLDKLNQLSLNRMKNFKNYMIDTHEIESARLLLCAPKIDIAKNAKPRLTFSN